MLNRIMRFAAALAVLAVVPLAHAAEMDMALRWWNALNKCISVVFNGLPLRCYADGLPKTR
jgi:hypothetical protein